MSFTPAGTLRADAIDISFCSARLDQLVQLFERRGILGADRRVLAARIGSLQCSTHVAGQWDRGAAVARLADEIPFGTSHDVAPEAVAAEPMDDVDESSSPDLASSSRVAGLKPLARLTIASPGMS
jgi:hypothetical protein